MCKIARLDICRLIQESFVSPTFEFGDVDISNDTFVYTVKKYLTENKREIGTIKIDNNTLVIAEHDLKIGKYEHELMWIHGNNKDVVVQGIVEVTDKGSSKGCRGPKSNIIEVVTENTIVNVTYSENVINIGGDSNWGQIQGDIQNQTDLVEFIDEKIEEVEVDLSNYDTRTEVDTKINDAKDWVENQDFVTSSELPSVGNGTVTITQGGVEKGKFTTNQSGNTTIEINAYNEHPTLQDVAESGNTTTIPLKVPYAVDNNDVVNFGQIKQWGVGTDKPMSLNTNDTRPSGFYNFDPSVGGTVPFGWGSLIHVAYKGDTNVLEFAQIAIEQGGSRMAFRNKDAITINPWRTVWTDYNLKPSDYALSSQVYTRTQANNTFVSKTANGDIELPAGKGLILRDDNGVRWKLRPSITGESIWELAT